MKKSNTEKRKLSKKDLKEINGGAGTCAEGLCKLRGVPSHFMIIGPVGKNGYCC